MLSDWAQNRADRAVTRKFWFTPTRVLLADCGWLSVRQLVSYHSILSAHKMVTSKKPLYMHNALSTIHPLRTRQATGGQIIIGENFNSKQGLLHDSFTYRAAKDYNSIPAYLRSTGCLTSGSNWTYQLDRFQNIDNSIYLFIVFSYLSVLYNL